MKYNNKIGMMIVAGGMLAATSCSDFSDYNTAPDDFGMTGGKTLWQNISEINNLSKFAEIVEKVGFKSNLDAPTFYTLFAPQDGTYNADSVLQILESGLPEDTAIVLKEFVKQHVVQFNHPLNAALEESTLLSLNAKTHAFSPLHYGDATFTNNVNIPASNGVIHITNGNEGFYTNIYEYLDKIEGCDLFRDYVKKYDEQYIDESNSVMGPIVNGVQSYEYIEYAHRNSVINGILRAQLENEDSLYTMLFPNDKAWTNSYNRIHKDYKYLKKMSYTDLTATTVAGASMKVTDGKADITVTSDPAYLTDSLTKKMMISDLAFSHGYPCNDVLLSGGGTKVDSVFSTTRDFLVSAKDIEDHTLEKYRMSNGFVRLTDSIPFQPWQTFEPIITTTRRVRVLNGAGGTFSIAKEKFKKGGERDTLFKYVPDYFYDRILGEKSGDSKYFTFTTTQSTTQSSIPELDFAIAREQGDKYISNVLSTTYHIYVLTIPNQILDNVEEGIITKQKPYYLSFYLNYTDSTESGDPVIKHQQLFLSENADPSWGPKEVTESKVRHIVTEPGYAQVIDLGEFTFPVSYYGTEACPSLMMCHTQKFNTSTKRNSYEHELRVAGVYLVPVEANDYFITKSDKE